MSTTPVWDGWNIWLTFALSPAALIAQSSYAHLADEIDLNQKNTDARLRKTYNDGGMDLYPQDQESPEAARALLKDEIKLWGEVIRANHIAAQ